MSNWCVVRTKPKQEQRAKLNLENQGFSVFLPMLNIEKIRRGKKTPITEPLFPGYLFIELDEVVSHFHKIKNTFGVNNLLMFGDKVATLTAAEIDAMRNLTELEERVQQTALPQPGEVVEIIEGPFKGILAKVVKLSGADRCIVLIDWLNQEIKANLEHREIAVRK